MAEQLKEAEAIPLEERVLTDVDQLAIHRRRDGSYPDNVLADILQNKITAVQEAAMPNAVSEQEYEFVSLGEKQKGVFMWLGKTAVEVAEDGLRYHRHPSARERVHVEIDEAEYSEEDLRPGIMKVFISPKMTRQDASRRDAEEENLAEEDAVRVSWLETDADGSSKKKKLQSLLVRDIPLEAWVKMLQDPSNLFGKKVDVVDDGSALSVMNIHHELEVPVGKLVEGPIGVVEAVLPFIDDEFIRHKVIKQIRGYRGDQADLRQKAENIAERWLKFDVALDQSLADEVANEEITGFIYSLQKRWNEDDAEVIDRHRRTDGGFTMTRALQVILENAKQNTLWVPAAVLAGNEEVIKQMDPAVAKRIYDNEMKLQRPAFGIEAASLLERQNNQLIADEDIKVGGGCAGINRSRFGKRNKFSNGEYGTESEGDEENSNDSKEGTVRCINKKCRAVVPKRDVVKSKSWCCPRCKCEVDICTGKVIYEGNGSEAKEDLFGLPLVGVLAAEKAA